MSVFSKLRTLSGVMRGRPVSNAPVDIDLDGAGPDKAVRDAINGPIRPSTATAVLEELRRREELPLNVALYHDTLRDEYQLAIDGKPVVRSSLEDGHAVARMVHAAVAAGLVDKKHRDWLVDWLVRQRFRDMLPRDRLVRGMENPVGPSVAGAMQARQMDAESNAPREDPSLRGRPEGILRLQSRLLRGEVKELRREAQRAGEGWRSGETPTTVQHRIARMLADADALEHTANYLSRMADEKSDG